MGNSVGSPVLGGGTLVLAMAKRDNKWQHWDKPSEEDGIERETFLEAIAMCKAVMVVGKLNINKCAIDTHGIQRHSNKHGTCFG
ncbi:hypothetical protein VNO77_43671 [Canavalia gladiata]|uniref:Uncharacterized protein n=1 Tax=Canavalia gladiata TaxID=3824 RepID=A0AAN9JUI7_CANGL